MKKASKEEVKLPEFDARKYLENPPEMLNPKSASLNVSHQEVILMVGVQGSGKSHFAEKHLGKSFCVEFSCTIL